MSRPNVSRVMAVVWASTVTPTCLRTWRASSPGQRRPTRRRSSLRPYCSSRRPASTEVRPERALWRSRRSRSAASSGSVPGGHRLPVAARRIPSASCLPATTAPTAPAGLSPDHRVPRTVILYDPDPLSQWTLAAALSRTAVRAATRRSDASKAACRSLPSLARSSKEPPWADAASGNVALYASSSAFAAWDRTSSSSILDTVRSLEPQYDMIRQAGPAPAAASPQGSCP